VCYSVPHSGSRLADWGWQLRFVGGAPARSVQRLRTGGEGREGADADAFVRSLVERKKLPVLSFGEGRPTKVVYIKTRVVDLASAHPGYGEFVVLDDHDHIAVCKPRNVKDPAYTHLEAFLDSLLRKIAKERADKDGGGVLG
ncbi:hypothetical protein H632_c1013p2, partial [Helicosporidium sp. ATCC 50920]